MKTLISLLCLVLSLHRSLAFAEVSIRSEMTTCQTLLVLESAGTNDSTGQPFSSADSTSFAKSLQLLSDQDKLQTLKGSRFFVTGVAMGSEKKIANEYYKTLSQFGLSRADVKVRVLSVPKGVVEKTSRRFLRDVFERTRYWFPSMVRDYQTPLKAEVISGLLTSALVESANIVYLFRSLSLTDATLTVVNHTAMIVAIAVYTKTMVNWLLRAPKTNVEIFLKQASISVPFVLNYRIFGNFTKIVNFNKLHGWPATLQAFPHEALSFATTQGFSLFLQTVFYTIVMTKGIQQWVYTQSDPQRSARARALGPWIGSAFLAIDAVFLAKAANAHALLSMGPLEVNEGHLWLIGLTLVGYQLARPKLLDGIAALIPERLRKQKVTEQRAADLTRQGAVDLEAK